MKDYALLIGNGINNINPGKSWEAILDEIISFCGLEVPVFF
ncbi:hypothetical protein ACFFGT_28625 [Mucilaginibacter angelicae]|uniref:Uncharacterized protein n=1 Tax=Mucilaginibacter angelicae TaxID=869718 RepID=A0ABV6LFG7_9SPHI